MSPTPRGFPLPSFKNRTSCPSPARSPLSLSPRRLARSHADLNVLFFLPSCLLGCKYVCPFCASLYIQNLEECLAHSRFSIDIGWMIDYFSYKRQPSLQVGMSITDTDGDPEGKSEGVAWARLRGGTSRHCEADSSVRTCLPFWFTSKYLPEGLL